MLLTLAAVLLAACAGQPPGDTPPPEVDRCAELEPLSLEATPPRVRVGQPVELSARGGSGQYRFSVEPGGSGGELRGARFIAGPTPASDRLRVEDACAAQATAMVEVVAAFQVRPARATVKPGTSFQIAVSGTLGDARFELLQTGSGGALTSGGRFTAGPTDGIDLVKVSDGASGEEALLVYRVSAAARFRASPPRLALPSGSSVPLATADGSDSVDWTLLSGPGALESGRFSAPADAAGTAELEVRDRFTGETARATVRILDELVRPTEPHGRLFDVASIATGDLDGDGLADVAVGVPESDLAFPAGGAVLVFRGAASGLPAAPDWTLTGASANAHFGANVEVGDLDGDGRADLVVAAPEGDITIGDSGALYLYSFASGAPKLLRPPLTGVGRSNLGAGLAVADLDGDGDLDLASGSPTADLATTATVSRRGVIDLFLLEEGAPIPDVGQIRLSGMDLAPDGTVVAARDVQAGRSIAVGDLNGDGRTDLAVLGKVNNALIGGVAVARNQVSVQVYFSRGPPRPFEATPDAYVLPSNEADTSEGSWRLGIVPSIAGAPPLLLVVVDGADSPDLSATGGNKSGVNAGGALLFDLSAMKPAGPPAPQPWQLGLGDAFARFYGENAYNRAGRSFALVDVNGEPGPELILGAPYAWPPASGGGTLRQAGELVAFPLAGLARGTVLNTPLDSRGGQERNDVLGTGLAPWPRPDGVGLLAMNGRSTTPLGKFTGRVEAIARAPGGLASWSSSFADVPARPASESFGVAVSAATGEKRWVLVGAPGFSGPGVNDDGNDVGAGQVSLFDAAQPSVRTVVAEGALSPLIRSGRSLGSGVAFTDFDGDGRKDIVIGAPSLQVPGSGARATDITPHYAQERAGCIDTSTQSTGGVQVHLARPDGTFAPAFRLWAPSAIAGCTPDGSTPCRRAGIGRSVAGGFDFDGDGKQDLAATRNNGLEVFLGRAPDDPTLGKLTMGCDPVLTVPYLTHTTSAATALGDLDGDGCAEVGFRYSSTNRSGLYIAFGFDPGGVRCGGGDQPAAIRLSGDPEAGSTNMNLGIAATRAGKVLGDGRDFLAVSAAVFPVEGVTQPAVLLFDVAALSARRPASGEVLVGALGDGLTPIPLIHRERSPGFGQAIAGGVDLTGDAVPDLVVSAPGASIASDGGGALFVYAGGPSALGALEPIFTAVGDVRERSLFGQDLALSPATGGHPPTLVIGAPNSFRTGTQNGTAFTVPLSL